MRPKVAVIQFPGVNCEYETQRALISSGLDARIFRWNLDVSELSGFDAFILPGGFSYQDRIRAGAIAAKDAIVEEIAGLAGRGKPILGICNGAQVLVEAGLVPGLSPGQVEMALGPNRTDGRSGYLCTWVHTRVSEPHRTAFTCAVEPGEVLPLPIAHAEGRFLTLSSEVVRALREEGMAPFLYCKPDGVVSDEYPWNPNGSLSSAAAVSSRSGNVMAMMPHPERAAWLSQVPDRIEGPWGRAKREAKGNLLRMKEAGPGRKIFDSLKRFLS
ncbi:MAG: phosphoribosylformylglycinamidine synthase I [Candidatus Eiseniibacteriota bacterium]|nr:MAG: phosphoribosylformylglycinamidine synthase I [Candidatus Eisenbacteria bacterium]